MDLNDLIPSNDTIVVELEYKDKKLTNEDGSPMTIEVYLPHTKEYKQARHERQDFYLSKQDERLKSAEMEELGLTFVAQTIKGWNITLKGEKPKFTVKRAVDVFEKLPFIPELILEEVSKVEDFT